MKVIPIWAPLLMSVVDGSSGRDKQIRARCVETDIMHGAWRIDARRIELQIGVGFFHIERERLTVEEQLSVPGRASANDIKLVGSLRDDLAGVKELEFGHPS